MATKIVTKNSSTASAVPTTGDLVQGELAVNVADKRLFTEDNGGSIVELGTNPSGNVTFQDNGKAIFGAGSDLQIYHDGANSYVTDAGTGDLRLSANNLRMQNADNTVNYIKANNGSNVELFFNNASKLSTTSTGIDVTGTATMDGLTVPVTGANAASLGGINIGQNGTDIVGTVNGIALKTSSQPLALFASNGDISFYEDTGTTAKFFWDASAESLGIGTSSPSRPLTVNGDNGAGMIVNDATNDKALRFRATGDAFFIEATNNAESAYANLALQGNVGIGTSSPLAHLDVKSDTGSVGFNYGTISSPSRGNLWYDTDGSGWKFDIGKVQSGSFTSQVTIQDNGNVGIGTSSPASLVTGGSSPVLSIGGTDGGLTTGEKTGALSFITSDGSYTNTYSDGIAGEIVSVAESSTGAAYGLAFYTGTISGSDRGERLRIRNNGYVGIGTSSPTVPLHILKTATGVNQATDVLRLSSVDTSTSYYVGFQTQRDNSAGMGLNILTTNVAGTVSESMRIDSSGNLLVGKSLADNTTAGTTIYGAVAPGAASFVRDAGNTLVLNRLTSDGEILAFRKDGTTVGGIGTFAGGTYIGNGTTGIRFSSNLNAIIPVTSATGEGRGSAIDIGYVAGSTVFDFKDLYLSGGVYLGGTGAANKLDDYEEGTWTGTLTGSTSAPITAITATGTYTKIGRSVTAVISFSNKDSTGVSGNIIITGLPFTASAGGVGAGWCDRSNTGTGTTNGVMSFISSNNDLVLIRGLGNAITWASAGTGTYAGYSITYEV